MTPARPTGAGDHSTSPPHVLPDSSVRRTARIVGVLVLVGYLYGVGSLIATGIVDSGGRGDSTVLFVAGIALMLPRVAKMCSPGWSAKAS